MHRKQPVIKHYRSRLRQLAVLAVLLPVMACDLDVPDLNNVPEEDLREKPTPALVRAAAQGLLIGTRVGMAETNGYVSLLGLLGREAYNLDAAEPRLASEMLAGPELNPGSPALGGNLWVGPYANIHNAHNLLYALDRLEEQGSVELTAGEIEGMRGFAKTIQALDYTMVISTRDVNGAALVTDETVTGLPPLVSREQIYAHIIDLLDQGQAHLQADGAAFDFALSDGFVGFDTPDAFLLFNRALRARINVYAGNYEAALEDLGASFLSADPASPRLDLGVYHTYSILSGDLLNELVSPTIVAHPSVVTDAEAGDLRVAQKVETLPEPRSLYELSSDIRYSIYSSSVAPVSIIRNEELILLRAEANMMLGNIDPAIADLNFLRVHSGGLAERADLNADNIEDELLYQRRYGLMFEGHRWIDMRRFGRLDELPLDRPDDRVHDTFPIPLPETDPRPPGE